MAPGFDDTALKILTKTNLRLIEANVKPDESTSYW